MKAELKNILVSDIDPEKFWPEDEEDFGFYIQATIGSADEDGGNVFGFQVCTPKWLEKQYGKNTIIFGRHKIIVFEYNYEAIVNKIASLCDRTYGENWNEIANRLSMYGFWEFEDYKPFRPRAK